MTLRNTQLIPLLETPCEKCGGSGYYSEGGGEKEPCDICNGAGYTPTKFGERILSLMRHNLRSMIARHARRESD
jgi:DnaJ-class molecular chaperone